MNAGPGESVRTFSNPLPGPALGDPFVLRHGGRFYLYGTNDGPPLPDGRAVPVYRSDDLVHWEFLGGALTPLDPAADHWAPEVLAWNGRFYMVVSFGDVEHVGHALWVAKAERPEGPFRLRARISGEDERFSIDGAWLLDDDGQLYLYRCVDFIDVQDPPHGTGIVVQPMRNPLTPAGPPRVVLRAFAPWQVFERDRLMPLYGGRMFGEWTTIEGPAPVKRGGRYFCGYSGGNYQRNYGTGEAVADAPLGPYQDLRGREGPLFRTTPGLIEGPGHFSVIRPDLVHDWVVLHGRSPGEPVRRVWLCPASWGPDGVAIGPLTTAPQLAPQLPAEQWRFGGAAGPAPEGWSIEQGDWATGPEGLEHRGPELGLLWREAPPLTDDWVIELEARLLEPGGTAWGLVLETDGRRVRVLLDHASGQFVVDSGEGDPARGTLPVLGESPFAPSRTHSLTIRRTGGTAEIRVDRVRALHAVPLGDGPWRLGLCGRGESCFECLSISRSPA